MGEVKEGRSLAPGMDPDTELHTLKQRFAAFKRDFKVPSVEGLQCDVALHG